MHSKDPLGFRFLFATVPVLWNSCGLVLLGLVNVLFMSMICCLQAKVKEQEEIQKKGVDRLRELYKEANSCEIILALILIN